VCPDDAYRYLKILCGDRNILTRGNAVFVLSVHFADRADTFRIARACAVEDADEFCRNSALGALASRFRRNPETRILLRARAIEDADQGCRGTALMGLSRMLGEVELPVLASRYLDGRNPGRDPREPITAQDIANAAAILNETEERIRELYRRLTDEVPLTFA
jgi:hypothetical protein